MLSRLKWFQIFRYYYIIIIVFSLLIVIILSCFLYKNFYQTITQSGELLILKEQTGVEAINIDKFEQIIKNSHFKQNNSPGFLIQDKAAAELTNPFSAYEAAKPAS